MKENAQNRRRNYFIKKQFQAGFILKFCFLMAAGIAISSLGLYIYSRSSMTTSFINSRLSIVSTADYLAPAILWIGLIAFFAIGIVAALLVMYLSHRIAGALFNIERSIKKISDGDLTCNIHLRTTDELKHMADSVNKMTESLRSDISLIKDVSSEIGKATDNLARISGENSQADKEIEVIRKNKEELDGRLERFKV